MRSAAWVAGVVAAACLSVKGLLCDTHPNDTRWELVPLAALLASPVLAVVLVAVLLGRAGRARLLSPVPLVVLPLLTLGVLAVPPDTCSDEARRDHWAYACSTTPDG